MDIQSSEAQNDPQRNVVGYCMYQCPVCGCASLSSVSNCCNKATLEIEHIDFLDKYEEHAC